MAKPLTLRTIENYKPDPAKRCEISDGGSGLYFVIQPSGARSWAYRYRFGSRPCKLTIGSYPLFGLADARAKAREAQNAVDCGRDPSAEKISAKGVDGRKLYSAAAVRFIERYAKVHNKRWQQTARLLGFRLVDGN